jgi:hypothetical protein
MSGSIDELLAQRERSRWLRDAKRASEHYGETGEPLPKEPTPHEKVLTAIFGEVAMKGRK